MGSHVCMSPAPTAFSMAPRQKMMRTCLMIFATMACLQVSLAVMCDPKWDHPDDCAALADLYEATNGKGWTFDGSQKDTNWATWNNGSSICGEDHSGNWFGIECSMPGHHVFKPGTRQPCQDTVFCVPPVLPYQTCPINHEHTIRPKHCRVSSIDLTGNNLVGTIPESVTKLPYVAELHLAFNKLTGAVPLSLDQNKYLTLLALNNNSLTSWGDGIHPNICSQFGDDPNKLSYCVIRDNPFKCPVPDCVKKQCDATCTDDSPIAPIVVEPALVTGDHGCYSKCESNTDCQGKCGTCLYFGGAKVCIDNR